MTPNRSPKDAPERQFVLGQGLRATILATAEETDGDVVLGPPGATPADLAGTSKGGA
jgi:hypothetical protein